MKKIYIILISIFAFSLVQAQQNKFNLVVGTYTTPCESKGIYVYDFDSNTGDVTLKSTSENTLNPSYLTLSNDNKKVYAVNQNDESSTVSSFAFDSLSGQLILRNQQDSKGARPCYIINDDKNVLTANYASGSISVFGKNADGSITEAKQVVQHFGKGVNPKRQLSPHVHMLCFSPDKKYVLASDLGTDGIYVYQYNPSSNNETLVLKDSIAVKPGSGPRHFTFSKDGKYVYLLQELDGGLTSFSYTNGTLKKVFETSILSKDFKGDIASADIHISPDGKFLYATNRGTANDISIFKLLKKGRLELMGHTSTLGKGPRNFAIDPTGNYLLVGHQHSNEVVIFKRDKSTGSLTDTGKRIPLCSPVCLVFSKI